VEVFARYFFARGLIDARSHRTYILLVEHFLAELPTPDLLIYCRCSLSTARQRIQQRGRSYQELYPPHHLEDLAGLYDTWLRRVSTRTYTADSDNHDWRLPNVLDRIAQDVLGLLRLREHTLPQQRYLFPQLSPTPAPSLQLLRLERQPTTEPAKSSAYSPIHRPTMLPYPSIYVAAPYSSRISPSEGSRQRAFLPTLDDLRIPPGSYRKVLSAIARTLTRAGMHVVLPHSRVSRWGLRHITPSRVLEECTGYVVHCDILLAILATSCGAHYECGVAAAHRKPIVAISVAELGESFLASGLTTIPLRVLKLRCARLEDVPELLRAPATQAFLHAALHTGGLW
jgi:hypothetical protein